MVQPAILSTAYLGPVQYYTKFLNHRVVIEKFETYLKQTYRNRCVIMTGNGPENLTIPVIRPFGNHTLVKDVQLDNSRKWQLQHWRALIAAYNNTPFFEFYADDFAPFYEHKYTYLLDFNEELNRIVLENTGLDAPYSFSESYQDLLKNDFRDSIHPKKSIEDPEFRPIEYHQVFGEKYGFVQNLSIVDLLFNCGPEALLVLKQSVQVH
ncbi:WbqC family protein [Saccharicrinis sp. FJH54]|uniref:WbqC family protein n=1 Tax=Saccharicrinis sp. FJH54 TaxID=3344665 RepID=UPI0035D4B22B